MERNQGISEDAWHGGIRSPSVQQVLTAIVSHREIGVFAARVSTLILLFFTAIITGL